MDLESTNDDVRRLKEHASTCSWLRGYGAVSSLISAYGAQSILEIGVAYGYHALHLLDEHPQLEYVGVDPYVSDYDPNDQFATDVQSLFRPQQNVSAENNHSMDRLYKAVSLTINQKSTNARVVRSDFINFSLINRNLVFDIIYIDGNHMTDYVFADTILAKQHIKSTGIICGDDIERPSVQDGLTRASRLLGEEPKLYKHPKTGKYLWMLIP